MTRTLEEQRIEFSKRRLLAMPLAGTIAWLIVAISAAVAPNDAVWVLFIAVGSIFYLGVLLSRLTGENFLDKAKPKNTFDGLFLHSMVMALLVYSIAIPFFIADHSSLPLTVGILTGLMWLPLSWIIQHWVGVFHGVARTLLIVTAWYAFPAQRFVVIPAIVVAIYLITIIVLESRWRKINHG